MLKSQLRRSALFLRPALIFGAVVVAGGTTTIAREPARARTTSTAAAPALFRPAGWDTSRLGSLDPHVFNLALNAASCAVRSGRIAAPATLTVIDYSKPSTLKRLWVIDLRSRALLFEELVAHGQGSGSNMATRFSNEPETHRSSIGLFETKDTYIGKNGYSLRLKGLDEGFNDMAWDRAIVMHGASYVSQEAIKVLGRLGRSWGCPAVSPLVAQKIIDTIRGGSAIFSYYPDKQWLSKSAFLH